MDQKVGVAVPLGAGGGTARVGSSSTSCRSSFCFAAYASPPEDSGELAMPEDLRRNLEARDEITHRQRLHVLLDDALRREDRDVAAQLRRQLRDLETDK